MTLQETHFKYKDSHRLIKKMEKTYSVIRIHIIVTVVSSNIITIEYLNV